MAFSDFLFNQWFYLAKLIEPAKIIDINCYIGRDKSISEVAFEGLIDYKVVQLNLAIRNFLVALKLFLSASSLSL